MTQNGTRKKVRSPRTTPKPALSNTLAVEGVEADAVAVAPESVIAAAQIAGQHPAPVIESEPEATVQQAAPQIEAEPQADAAFSAADMQQPEPPVQAQGSQTKESDPVGSFAPRNFLMPYLLLLLRDLNMHGYELWEKLTRLGFPGFNENDRATVYRALRQLEKEGKVASHWETTTDGPARRVYSLTVSGESFLQVWATGLEQYRRTLDFFFSMYSGAPPTQLGTAKTPAEAAASMWTAALDANPWTNPSLNPLLAPYTQKGRNKKQGDSDKDPKKPNS